MKTNSYPACEQLENRRLLAAMLVDGVLKAVGSSGDDQISVGLGDGSTTRIEVNINGSVSTFRRGAIKHIVMLGLAGNDDLFVSNGGPGSLYNPFPLSVFMKGGDGSDKLHGGIGNDTLLGGRGGDEFWGYEGNDQLYGGGGNDWFVAGSGDDFVNGGVGNDILNGEHGNDTLLGGVGDDALMGNEGADSLFGGAGRDRLYGGDGGDYLFGARGNDYLQGDQRHDRLMGGKGKDQFAYVAKNDDLFDFTPEDSKLG